MVEGTVLPFHTGHAMVVEGQAKFDPLRYVRRFAAALQSAQCRICEGSPVIDIDTDAGIVRTHDYAVRADHIVMATHTPKGFDLVQTELGPYREYAVAAPMGEQELPNGIFWSVGDDSISIRRAPIDGRPWILVIGEMFKTGQYDEAESSWHKLEDHLRNRFGIRIADGVPVLRWAAQQYRSADGLPYIGSTSASSNLYLATGFGADGLTWGTLAGMMIADEICGRKNPFAELYSPRRFTPMKSAKNFLKENLNVAGRYIRDYTQDTLGGAIDLPRGEGALLEVDGQRVAAYRDEDGRLHALLPTCTHLKCIVQWNRAERSWDCPCHGSRFRIDGSVIEGPALAPLKPHLAPPKVGPSTPPSV